VPRLVFLDTSFIVALENRDDPLHERAEQLDREMIASGCSLLLHWGILLEVGDGYARIGRRFKAVQLLDRFVHEQGYLVHPISPSLLEQAMSLYCGRMDKDWGLTDCVSFVLMKQEGTSDALTADAHFRQAGFRALLLD